MNINICDIKIVIWDLDDTFWKGTLSEEDICPIVENIKLVKDLTDRGIINSICSKNDEAPVLEKLEEFNILDFFVFPSINWLSKGERIKSILKEMGLRPQNCLFIDDNIANLEEAKHSNPGILIMLPYQISGLIEQIPSIPTSDVTHKRLQQYKVLEEKVTAAKEYSDNTDFLYSSNIRVQIHRDCGSQLDRIVELVQRSNQLNFTKVRSTKEELEALIADSASDCGYVTVQDNFGDYGLVGFFAVKNNRCVHLLFSCRTIGSGVEEYVYAQLGYPELTIVAPVINQLEKSPSPGWINQNVASVQTVGSRRSKCKVVFKGGCELTQMREYIISDNIIEEFYYIGKKRNNNIEHHNHSINYLQWHFLSSAEKQNLVDGILFNDDEMFDTHMYDDVSMVILPTMIEPNLGIYRNKATGFEIAFGESSHPLTDPEQQKLYLANKIFTCSNNFTQEWLDWFSSEYEFVGNLTPDQILENSKKTLSLLNPNTTLVYILGPEIKFEDDPLEHYAGREKIYASINRLFREWATNENRVFLLDVNKWVKSQKDFTNNINHWQRHVYYNMALEINEFIKSRYAIEVKSKGRFYLYNRILADKIGETGLYKTRLWRKFRGNSS